MIPIFIDTETTGVGETDRLCQLAFMKGGRSACTLFKPPVPISIEAMSITHITNEEVENLRPFIGSLDYAAMYETFTGTALLPVAHNAAFDLEMFRREGLPMPKNYICTMKIAHYYDKDALMTRHNLQYLRYYYGLKFDDKINPHDALSDVIVLEKLYNYYLQHYTVEEMIKISSQPILIKKAVFGKYRGEFYRDILTKDRDYLEWMWKNVTMDENLKYTVAYYLKGHHLTNKF